MDVPSPLLALADVRSVIGELERAVLEAEAAVAAALEDRDLYNDADRALTAANPVALHALKIAAAVEVRAHRLARSPGDQHDPDRKATVKRALAGYREAICRIIPLHNRVRRARQRLDLPPDAGWVRRQLARIVLP